MNVQQQKCRQAYEGKGHKFSGFTLIEILVALVILSVGLLGVASLQVQGLRSNQSAYLRSQATLLAYDIADRMRLNSVRAIAGDYNAFDTKGQVPANPNCISANAGCTPARQAQNDLFEWATRVNGPAGSNAIALLPDAQGTINRGAGNLFTVSVGWKEVAWDETTSEQNILDQSFSVNFSL
jgi:type IV pilus assembly protein PilV